MAAPGRPIAARACAVLCAGSLLVMLAGSLAPFELQALPLEDVLARLGEGIGRWQLNSSYDFLANILLAVPAAFFASGALLTGAAARRSGVFARVIAGLALTALALEAAQVFFPQRVPALRDVIAQSIGASLGCLVWLAGGPLATDLLRRLFGEHPAAGGPIPRSRTIRFAFLAAYALLFFVCHAFPLDFTLEPGELLDKYRQGRVRWAAARAADAGWARRAGTTFSTALPLGIAAALLALSGGRARQVRLATLSGAAVVVSSELAQALAYSRTAHAEDLLWGAVGVACGAILASSGRRPDLATTGAYRPDARSTVSAVNQGRFHVP